MNIALKFPNPQQHARLFLDDVIARYKAKLMSAAEYILNLLQIYRAKGQKLNLPSAKAFYEQFSIPKSTFYHALQRLKDTPDLGFNWEPTGGIALWLEVSEDTAAPSPTEKKEPTYTKLNQLPAALRNEFEIFVKSEWRKIKGEEIRSFHRFVESQKDFCNWWAKFQQHKMAAPAPTPVTVEPETATETKRTSSPMPDRLKGLLGKKPT